MSAPQQEIPPGSIIDDGGRIGRNLNPDAASAPQSAEVDPDETLNLGVKTVQAEDHRAFEEAVKLDTIESFASFLERFETSSLVERARTRFEILLHTRVLDAELRLDKTVLDDLISRHPAESVAGRSAREARDRLHRMIRDASAAAMETDWQLSSERGTVDALQSFLEAHPVSPHDAEARAALEEVVAFERAQREGTAAAWETFLNRWHGGRHAAHASRALDEVRLEGQRVIDAFLSVSPAEVDARTLSLLTEPLLLEVIDKAEAARKREHLRYLLQNAMFPEVRKNAGAALTRITPLADTIEEPVVTLPEIQLPIAEPLEPSLNAPTPWPAVAQPPRHPSARPKRHRPGMIVAFLILLILLGAAAAFHVWQMSLPFDPAAAAEVPPPVVASSLLVIDARPWAEIVAVRGSDGTEWPMQARHTPAVLQLPPGDYRVELRHPGVRALKTLEVTTAADRVTTCDFEFQRIEVDEYFRRAGWR